MVYVVFCFCNSTFDCLESLVSEMTDYVSSGTLNPTHSLTHLCYVLLDYISQTHDANLDPNYLL